MKIKCYLGNKAGCPTTKRCGRCPKGLGKLAWSSGALSVAIAFGTGCSSTGGFQAQLVVPAIQASQASQTVDSADGGGYHPTESPGRGQG